MMIRFDVLTILLKSHWQIRTCVSDNGQMVWIKHDERKSWKIPFTVFDISMNDDDVNYIYMNHVEIQAQHVVKLS